ncbi:hypothetical protein H9P43_008299 [Blastocladiella emersonii ATCC 22665]|nr:hypothetical protein H9P43_008299 [Blastocladiella emersonii ATCC 22665]
MPEDYLDDHHAWLDTACPVLAELGFEREAIFRLERVHHDGAGADHTVDRRAVECVSYRTVVAGQYDPSRKYSLDDFMARIEEDPYFTRRHRKVWGILKKSGRVVPMNVFSLASDPAFTAPDHGPTDEPAHVPPGSFSYAAPWARAEGDLLMPAGRELPSRPFVDLDPTMQPYLRLVLRPVRGARYPDSGPRFTYHLGVYLHADKANRDLCDPARRSATRGILRKLFRLYHPAMTKDSNADPLTLPAVGNGCANFSDWLAELEMSRAARTLSFAASRARSEPYFRLGPGGMVFNYLTGEFASTCPPSWLLPLPKAERHEVRAALVHAPSEPRNLCAGLLVPAAQDVSVVQAELGEDAAALIPSRATLVILPTSNAVDEWLAEAQRELGPSTRFVCLVNSDDHGATSWHDIANADVIFVSTGFLTGSYRSSVANELGPPWTYSSLPPRVRPTLTAGRDAPWNLAREFESTLNSRTRGLVDDGLLAGAKLEDANGEGVGRPILEGFFYRRIVLVTPSNGYNFNYGLLTSYFEGLRAGLTITLHEDNDSSSISLDTLQHRLRPVINCSLPRDIHVGKAFVSRFARQITAANAEHSIQLTHGLPALTEASADVSGPDLALLQSPLLSPDVSRLGAMLCGHLDPGEYAVADVVDYALDLLRELESPPAEKEWALSLDLTRAELPGPPPAAPPPAEPPGFRAWTKKQRVRWYRHNYVPAAPAPAPGPSVPFFALVQLVVEAREALDTGVDMVEVPAAPSSPDSELGAKVQAVLDTWPHTHSSKRLVIWCQSPVLAALVARAIATTTSATVLDAASPNLALANRAISEFHHGSPRPRALVLSLNAEDGSALTAPIFPARVNHVDQVLFVHPVVGGDEAETLKIVDRAIRFAEESDVSVKWLVAKDTVEAQLMQPVMAKYGFAQNE